MKWVGYSWLVLFITGLSSACFSLTDEAKVRYVLQLGASSHITVDMFIISASDGHTTWDIDGSDFMTSDGLDAPHTPYYKTMRSGTLTIDFTIASPQGGEPISEGSVSLPLRSDWAWSISFHPSSVNPYEFCFGCSGYESFSLAETYRDTVADSLYVIWGGNSIKNPVIY